MEQKIIDLVNEMYDAIGGDEHVVACDYGEMYDRVKELHRLVKNLTIPFVMASAFDCLEKIADPIKYMQKQASKDGYTLNGEMAIRLANDPNYLQGIASEFLKQHLP